MIRPLLAAERRAFANGLREPRRRRLLLLAGGVSLALAASSAWRFTALLAVWRSAGLLTGRLWGVCTAAWAAAGALGILACREQAAGDRARLLFTLPLAPADRARALAAAVAAQLSNLWLLSLAGLGTALVAVLGWRAWAWLAVVLLGQALALLGVGCCLALAAVRSRRGGILAFVAVLLLIGAVFNLPVPPVGYIAALFGLLLLAGLGPLATPLGRLYERAFQALLVAAPKPRRRPLARGLTAVLGGFRTPTAALLTREILSRGRQWVDGFRLALAAGLLAGYPAVRPILAARGLPDAFALPAAVSLLGLLFLVDGAASPLGGEGHRLALLLTANLSPGDLLRAKLAAVALPLLAGGVGATVVLGQLAALPGRERLATCLAVAAVLSGLAALFAWGSAWDADLSLEIEGGLKGVIQEQTPLTPVRVVLVAAAALVLAADLALLRRLPPGTGVAALAGWNTVVLAASWRMGRAGLRRCVL